MKALEVFQQQNGEATKAFYAELDSKGPLGQVATALFRAQKRSSRAKDYRPGKFRRAAYDVKSWSMNEVCRLLSEHAARFGITWGWQEDRETKFAEKSSWVLYVELPCGQVSFHSPDRLNGPDYKGKWDGSGFSAARIIQFADGVIDAVVTAEPLPKKSSLPPLPVTDDGWAPWIPIEERIGEPHA